MAFFVSWVGVVGTHDFTVHRDCMVQSIWSAWYSQYGGDYTGLLDAGVGGGQLHGLGLQAGQVVGQEQQLG